MITEQNYVGRGTFATTRPHPAQQGHVTPLPVEKKPFDSASPQANLQQIQQELVAQISAYAQEYSPVPLLNEIIVSWLHNPFQQAQDEKMKNNLRLLLNLTSFLVEIKETYQTYEFYLDQWNQGKEGQGND
ncbi:hypothetical protein GCM10028805_36510 [Spirosoma harenae]